MTQDELFDPTSSECSREALAPFLCTEYTRRQNYGTRNRRNFGKQGLNRNAQAVETVLRI